jgi:hypothetical protein
MASCASRGIGFPISQQKDPILALQHNADATYIHGKAPCSIESPSIATKSTWDDAHVSRETENPRKFLELNILK